MAVNRLAAAAALSLALAYRPAAAGAQAQPVTLRNDSVSVRLVDADVRAAVQSLGRYLDKPVLFGSGIGGGRVSLETPGPVPRSQVMPLLRNLLDSQGLEIVDAGGTYTVRSKQQAPPPQAVAPPPVVTSGPRGSGGLQLFVIRLRHARAADVAAVVNALYGRATALGETNGGRPSTLSSQLRDNRVPPAGVDVPVQSASAPGAVQTRHEASLSGETTIVPDPRTNSLLIRANPDDFDLIRAAVDQVDIRPLQVLIEVVIATVNRNSSFALGLAARVDSARLRGTQRGTITGTTQGAIDAPELAIRAMHLGKVDLDLTLQAAEGHGDVTVLSRPVLLAANNERATISVGDQIPFVQVRSRTEGGAQDQIVQFKDVSTALSVVPTISPEGYVALEVTQEINSRSGTDPVLNTPIIATRSVETQLLVRDGQTAVLGGLTDRERTTGSTGIPVLSRLPLLGSLFGQRNRSAIDQELFIFLTPRVIRVDEDLDDVTGDVRANTRRVGKVMDKARPLTQPARPTVPPEQTTPKPEGPPAP